MGHLNLNIPFLITTKGPQEVRGLRGKMQKGSISQAGFQRAVAEEGSPHSLATNSQTLDGWRKGRRHGYRLSGFQYKGTKVMVTDFKVSLPKHGSFSSHEAHFINVFSFYR